MLAPSVLPSSRFFPAPDTPFDTEIAVVAASNVSIADELDPAVVYVAAEDAPESPRFALVRSGVRAPGETAQRVIDRLRPQSSRPELPTQRIVVVEDHEVAEAMSPAFDRAALRRTDLLFRGLAASELAAVRATPHLELDSLVGDDAWRTWAEVEREILAEAIAPARLSEALLDRSVRFKRRQQREPTPIRRFVARLEGEEVGMIGYAPFSACDLGLDAPGVLVRLRDVAILARHRRRGLGVALLRAVAARAIDECGATQVLICGARDGVPAALYARVGAKPLGTCAMWSGEPRHELE
ncbi:MAG: GNAT family N-acetyltransferase [Polyangiales bacterium]